MNNFFCYLTHPFRIIDRLPEDITLWHSCCSVLLFALTIGATFNTLSIMFIVSLFMITLMMHVFFSIIIDFILQLFGKASNSIQLFKWISLSLMLWILLKPIQILSDHISSGLVSIIYLAFYFILFRIQVFTIKTIYDIPWGKAALVWLAPSVGVAIASIAIAINFINIFF